MPRLRWLVGTVAGGVGDHAVAKVNGARIGMLEACDQVQRRGLAAAGGAEHGGERTGRELHADVVDGNDGAEGFAHVLETNALHQA